MVSTVSTGPLTGVRVVEFAGLGPAPMCGMLLADLGAQVLRLEREEARGLGIERPSRFDLLNRGKRSLKVDLKSTEGIQFALSLIANSDILIEGFRPGTMERLGLGPDVCLRQRPALVYGRMTGFGQAGPLSQVAGHDLNYIAIAGVLHLIGRVGAPPTPPLNLVGDFGGGGMLLALGLTSALLHARTTGEGQVVDAAMVDGAALLSASFWGLRAGGLHMGERGTNLLDSGAPHYEVYRCADGEYIAVAPLEPKFRAELLRLLGLDPQLWREFDDTAKWPQLMNELGRVLAQRTRAEWCTVFEGSDACVTPVLSPDEAASHPHNVARNTFVEVDGVMQPAPAPRFSRTSTALPAGPQSSTDAALEWVRAWGVLPPVPKS